MKLRDTFLKDIDREIDGVIKANDEKRILTEVEEYVITTEILPQFQKLVSDYLESELGKSIWISGFFGSGKSHFLKMLSLLAENRVLGDKTVLEFFLEKPEISDDKLFQADLVKFASTPSQSILFNIDQRATTGKDDDSELLSVFTKVLNEAQGFYRKQEYIAMFERDLFKQGEYEKFKQAYENESGCRWEDDLDTISRMKNTTFAKVYANYFGVTHEEGLRIFDRYRKDYEVSVDQYVEWVLDYIDSQGPDFRLNFFVDEVGQFIGQNSRLMLKLQTLAEDLSARTGGRARMFVTAQGDLTKIIGAFSGMDFSKILGRFDQINLTGANVSEVIHKRLLAKKSNAIPALESLYESEKENLRTLFSFGDGSKDYRVFNSSAEFVNFTPFLPYQFELFQRSIESFSEHNMFAGKYQSVGERSMLAVFQQVAKRVANLPFHHFGTFDQMYDGIAKEIRPQLQTSLVQADAQLNSNHPLGVRILKCLFMLKHVIAFKATPRNVAILLIDSPSMNSAELEEEVKRELNYLYLQSYLQKYDDAFHYLTDAEKDIEVEIKNTRVEEGKIYKLLDKAIFGDAIRETKFRYMQNNQDYPFSRRLDGISSGHAHDIAINVITAMHDQAKDLPTLMAQNTGKRELLCVLPYDQSLVEDAQLHEQTATYAQISNNSQLSPERQAIIRDRRTQNATRLKKITDKASDLISGAVFVLNGSKLEVGGSEPRTRVQNAFQELVRQYYPNLRMLKTEYKESMIPKIIADQDNLLSETLSEAEQEVQTFLNRKKMGSERVSIADILANFRYGTYGWPDVATLCLVAQLFRRHKVELKQGTDILDNENVISALANSNHHGGVIVAVVEDIPSDLITSLKNFHLDFFSQSNPGADAKAVGTAFKARMEQEAIILGELVAQRATYPFVSQLEEITNRIREIARKDYTYPFKNLRDFDTDLLDAKEDFIDPIKNFIAGANAGHYTQIRDFLRDQASNLPGGDDRVEKLREVSQSETPFRGSLMPPAVAALSQLKEDIAARLRTAQTEAIRQIEAREASLRADPKFTNLSETDQEQVMKLSVDVKQKIEKATLLPVISDDLSKYETGGFSQQLAKLSKPKVNYKDTVKEPDPDFLPIIYFVNQAKAGKFVLQSQDDINSFMTALKSKLDEHVANGKQVTL